MSNRSTTEGQFRAATINEPYYGDDTPITAGILENINCFRWCKPGYYANGWPSHMYIGGKDGEAYLYIDRKPMATIKTVGDLHRLMRVFGLEFNGANP